MNDEVLNGATLGAPPSPVGTLPGSPIDFGILPPLNGEALNESVLGGAGLPAGTGEYIDEDYIDPDYTDLEYFIFQPPRVGPGGPQLFREALTARLMASDDLFDLVDDRIFYGMLPQRLDLGRDGPALTYLVVGRPTGHHLGGSDGTATARVQFSAWAYRESLADRITEVLRNMFDGRQPKWGDGTVKIMSIHQEDEVDLPEEPRAGSDQWTYQIASDYSIKHRVSLPTLS